MFCTYGVFCYVMGGGGGGTVVSVFFVFFMFCFSMIFCNKIFLYNNNRSSNMTYAIIAYNLVD